MNVAVEEGERENGDISRGSSRAIDIPSQFVRCEATFVIATGDHCTCDGGTRPPVAGLSTDPKGAIVVGLGWRALPATQWRLKGYRFFKSVLFLTGLLFGAGVIYLVCEKERVLPTLGNAGVALIAGTLFGLITMLIEYVGLFMTGFLTGQLVGAALLLCLHAFALVNTVWITIAVQFVAGLVLAQVMLVFQRFAMIAGTALIGGALVMASMDYLGQRLASVLYVWDVMNVRAASVAAVCWYSWAMIALWPLVFIVAALVQFRFTAVGYSHKAGYRLSRKDGHRGSAQRLTVSEDGRRRAVATSKDLHSIRVKENRVPTPEPETPPYQPKSFRLLYQARRNQGDVICQSYMESLKRPQHDRSATLSSDCTAMTDLASTFPRQPQQSN
uniref:Transmembrane protein 198 n=1 Tax=Plectus sambesii TaxID=2011161 RepID=A0A914W4W5_9BILA